MPGARDDRRVAPEDESVSFVTSVSSLPTVALLEATPLGVRTRGMVKLDKANKLKRVAAAAEGRALKLVDATVHPEPKMQRIAQLVHMRLLKEREEAAAAAAAAAQRAALGLANGASTEANGHAEDKAVKSEPDAEPDVKDEEDVKEEEGAGIVDEEEEIGRMTEELEVMQKQKHLLFVRLRELLKEDERKKAG